MAEQRTLTVEKRDSRGKGSSRRLRVQGIVPGVFYDSKGDNVAVQVNQLPLDKLYRGIGSSHVFNLEITDSGSSSQRQALIWDIVFHPYERRIMHVDFYGVEADKALHIEVPVELTGEPKGVKLGGGILDQYRSHIEVYCLPKDIPDKIVIDVTDLDVNDSVHIQDVHLPAGVEAVTEDNYAVVSVHIPQVREEEEEGAVGEEGAEAAEETSEKEEE